MITEIAADDVDWVYFYSQIPCDFLPDDIKEKLMAGFDFVELPTYMETIRDIIIKHKAGVIEV